MDATDRPNGPKAPKWAQWVQMEPNVPYGPMGPNWPNETDAAKSNGHGHMFSANKQNIPLPEHKHNPTYEHGVSPSFLAYLCICLGDGVCRMTGMLGVP